MESISGFWAGAVALGGRVCLGDGRAPLDLAALAGRAGGWTALARTDRAGLLALGAAPDVAETLLRTPSLATRGRAITRACPDYPARLAEVPLAPPVLFTEGDAAALRAPAVAIVGTRSCSAYGASVARRVAHACARAGIAVVSGLARGIDAAAHHGALSGGGRTIAVLGHGLAHTSPPANAPLRERMVGSGGLVVSALPDPVPPTKYTFPVRNAWIAALALRVVLVEAPERSGALHTARALADTSRDDQLYVVPGPLGDAGWRGGTALLRAGVRPLVEVDDLVRDVLGGQPASEVHPDWLSALFAGAPLDEVARLRDLPTVAVLREVARLELAGRVVRLPGGRYAPAGAP